MTESGAVQLRNSSQLPKRFVLCGFVASTCAVFAHALQAASDVDLGVVPAGKNGPVRLADVAKLPGNSQQMIYRGNNLFFALQGGVVQQYTKNPDGTLTDNGALMNVATERGSAFGNNPVGSANGLRGIAFHPDFDSNGKFYTMQAEFRGANPTHVLDPAWNLGTGSNVDSVLTEWTFNPATGTLRTQREVYRVQYPAGHPIGRRLRQHQRKNSATCPVSGQYWLRRDEYRTNGKIACLPRPGFPRSDESTPMERAVAGDWSAVVRTWCRDRLVARRHRPGEAT